MIFGRHKRATPKSLLSGEADKSSDDLVEFVHQARRLGWPHSDLHNRDGVIESAAADSARIRLDKERNPDSESIQHALGLITRTGLAYKVTKLVTPSHIETIARDPARRAWLVNFIHQDRAFPRSLATKKILALCSLDLLNDAQIDTFVAKLIEDSNSVLATKSSNKNITIFEQWTALRSNAQRLSVATAQRIIEFAPRAVRSDYRWEDCLNSIVPTLFPHPRASIRNASATRTLLEAVAAQAD